MRTWKFWTGGIAFRGISGIVVLLCVATLAAPVEAGCKWCNSISINSVAVVYDKSISTLAWPDRLKFTITVTYTHYGDCQCQCGAPPMPELTVTVKDAGGALIGSPVRRTYLLEPCDSPQSTTSTILVPFPCGRFPRQYEIETSSFCRVWLGGDICETRETQNIGPQGSVPSPIDPVCSATTTKPICPTTGSVAVEYYKESRTLYTLPVDDALGAQVGEAVNGEFIAPQKGVLFVTITKSSSAVSMRGSPTANAPGWQVPLGRQGVAPPGGCLNLNVGQRYQFNLWGDRGRDPPDFEATFDWFWWDSANWRIVHQTGLLAVVVKELPCLVSEEPIIPRRQDRRKSDGTVDCELRLPCCDEQVSGGLSDWFVAWPTESSGGKRIPQGHAKGLTIAGNSLISPPPAPLKYDAGN